MCAITLTLVIGEERGKLVCWSWEKNDVDLKGIGLHFSRKMSVAHGIFSLPQHLRNNYQTHLKLVLQFSKMISLEKWNVQIMLEHGHIRDQGSYQS